MNLRWLWFDLVPPEIPLSRGQREYVRWKSREYRPYSWVQSGVYLGVLVGAIVLAFKVIDLIPMTNQLVIVSMQALIVAAGWVCVSVIGRWNISPGVRRALRDLQFEMCVHCGYWLHGLGDDTTHCPECGAVREPLPPHINAQRFGRDVCISCGHYLHGLGDDVKQCPECGAAREPMPQDAANNPS